MLKIASQKSPSVTETQYLEHTTISPPLPYALHALPLTIANSLDEGIRNAHYVSIILALIVLIIIYFSSAPILGAIWALLPTLFTAAHPLFIEAGTTANGTIGEMLFALCAVYTLVRLLETPDTKHALAAGLYMGLALGSANQTTLLFPYAIITIALIGGTHCYSAWYAADETLRKKTIETTTKRYSKAILEMLCVATMVLYGLYALPITTTRVATTTTQPLVMQWARDNGALTPLVQYASVIRSEQHETNKPFITASISMGIILPIALFLGAQELFIYLWHAHKKRKAALIDVIEINTYETGLLLFLMLGIGRITGAVMIPAIMILISIAIRQYLMVTHQTYWRNATFHIALFGEYGVGILVKYGILILALIAYIAETIAKTI